MESSSVERPKAISSAPVPAPWAQGTQAEVKRQGDVFLVNAGNGCFSSGVDSFGASTDSSLGMFAPTACSTNNHSPQLDSLTALGLARTSVSRSRAPPVAVKLFVGRLPLTVTEDILCTLFNQFGPIADVVLIRDRHTNAFKGCAFVTMQSITDADRAIRHLDSAYVLDPALGGLQVKYAVGEAERLGLPGTSGSGAAAGVDQVKLFVGSLPPDIKEDALRDLFERFGRVEEVFLMKDEPGNGANLSGGAPRPGKKSRTGCAFVRFAYKEEAFFAISELNGKVIMPGSQRAMEVRFAENRRSSASAHGTTSASRTSSASASFLSILDCNVSDTPALGADGPEVGASSSFLRSQAEMERHARVDSLAVLGCLGEEQDFFASTSERMAMTAWLSLADRRRPVGWTASDSAVGTRCEAMREKRRSNLERNDEVRSKCGSIEDLFQTLGHLSLNGRGGEKPEAGHANQEVKQCEDAVIQTQSLSTAAAGAERQAQEGKPVRKQPSNPTHASTKDLPSGVWTAHGSRECQPPNTKEVEDCNAGSGSGSGGRTRAPSALDGEDHEIDIASLTAKLRLELAEFCTDENTSSTPSLPTSEAASGSATTFNHGCTSGCVSNELSACSSRCGGSAAGVDRDSCQHGTSLHEPCPSTYPSASVVPNDIHERISRNLMHPGGGALLPAALSADAFSISDVCVQATSSAAEALRNPQTENGDRLFPPDAMTWDTGHLPSLYAKADMRTSGQESLFSRRGDERSRDGMNRFLSGLRAQTGTLPQRGIGSQAHGPPGANVFIFHIPNEWSEHDLLTHFSVYGPVVSARIASDRLSGRNRGFGFVSFANGQAAAAAVTAMNGFQVNGKRLKVQIKKGEEQYAQNLRMTPAYNNCNDSTWLSTAASCSEPRSGVGDPSGNTPFLAVLGAPQRENGGGKKSHSSSTLDWLASEAKQRAAISAVPAFECAIQGESGTTTSALFEAALALRNISGREHSLHKCCPQEDAAAAAMLVATMRQPRMRRNQDSFHVAQPMPGEDADSTVDGLLPSSVSLYGSPAFCADTGSSQPSPAATESGGSPLGLSARHRPSAILPGPAYAMETTDAGYGHSGIGRWGVDRTKNMGDSAKHLLGPSRYDFVGASSRDV
ncbi:putative RNA binding protein [Toxoplasma gondii CAST]|uniref:Putative RNA binding protein n=1 Tax=Toxoplasma gondii CAST TaxID=943122 RepID=A0A3R8B815_TOXGO|nr:putative RNA binding protein [Toxoplasma gondii CAST]